MEMVYKAPVNTSATVSIAAGGSGTASVSVPDDERFHVKQVNVTSGADTTVSGISFDGHPTGQSASFDCEAVFGELLSANRVISASGDNAGIGAQDLTIEVIGISVEA